MKKTHILTLLLMLTVSVAFAQTPYKLNYPDITIGNSPTGKIVLNGSNLRLPRIATSSAPDSLLALVDGKVVKISNNYYVIASSISPQNIDINITGENKSGKISTGALSTFLDGSQSDISGFMFTPKEIGTGTPYITSQIRWQPSALSATNLVFSVNGGPFKSILLSGDVYSKYQVDSIANAASTSGVTSVNGRTGAVTGLEEASNKSTTLTSPNNTTYPTTLAVSNAFTNENLQAVTSRGATTNQPIIVNNTLNTTGSLRVGVTTGNNLLIDPNPGGNVKIRAFNNGSNQALEYVGGEHIFDGQLTLLSNISVPSYRANDFLINHENSAQKISMQSAGTNKLEVLSTGVRINNLSGTGPRMVGVDATGVLTAQGLVSSYANANGSNATGTWPISVTGNSATTTKWGGVEADFTQFGVNLFGFLAYNEFGMGRSYTMAQVKTALGVATQSRYTASGNGSSTAIVIPHGLTGITSTSSVIAFANSSSATGITFATIDATNITVNYTVAPASGTNNLIYTISIK